MAKRPTVSVLADMRDGKTLYCLILIAMSGVMNLIDTPSYAKTSRTERNSLRGATPITVVASSTPDWLEDSESTKSWVPKLIKTQLDDAKITTSDEKGDHRGTLVVVISGTRLTSKASQQNKGFVVLVTVNFMQGVRLTANNRASKPSSYYVLCALIALLGGLLDINNHNCYVLCTVNRPIGNEMSTEHNIQSKTVGRQAASLLAGLYDRSQSTFTLADAQEITGLSSHLASSLLHKAVRRGLVSRLKPGVFVIIPPELGSTSEYAGDPYLTAKRLAGNAPCFISHASAMEIHRMVTQPQLAVFASSSKRLRSRTLHGTEFRFVFIQPEHYFGTMKHWVTKQESVEISDLERTVIDGLRQPEYCGGVTEVAKGLWMRHQDMQVEKARGLCAAYWDRSRYTPPWLSAGTLRDRAGERTGTAAGCTDRDLCSARSYAARGGAALAPLASST